MTLTRKSIEQWNEDEALFRRYQELRRVFRLIAPNSMYLAREIDDWAWLEAVKGRGPLDFIGIVPGAGGND
jgi:hypothetical protein